MNESMQERWRVLKADHQQVFVEYEELIRHDVPCPDEDNPPPLWKEWHERFVEIKDRVYQLAYDLGIVFKSGEATADDYVQIWDAVQTALSLDGNRREFRLEDQMTPQQHKEYTNRVRGRRPSGKAIK